MKQAIYIITLLLISFSSFAQRDSIDVVRTNVAVQNANWHFGQNIKVDKSAWIGKARISDTLEVSNIGFVRVAPPNNDSSSRIPNTAWVKRNGSNNSKLIKGGTISSLPAIGNNPGTNISVDSFIISQFYASQPPTASLLGGNTFEFRTSGSIDRTLSWTAGRQSATSPIQSIIVDGVSQSFTTPIAGGTVAGTKIVAVPNNVNTTYSNTVTTTDSKTAIATTSFLWQNKIYAGFVSSATPTDAEIIAATGSSYFGGLFSASRNQSGALSTPSSSKFVVFVSPASYGTLNITINGLGLTYNQTTRSFTNASGGISSYIVAVSPFSTAGGIDSYLVN